MLDVMVATACIGILVGSVHYNIVTPEDEWEFGGQLSEAIEGGFWGAAVGMHVYIAASVLTLYTSQFIEYYRYKTAFDIGRTTDLSSKVGMKTVATEDDAAVVWVNAFKMAAQRKIYFRIQSAITPENMVNEVGKWTGFGAELRTAGYELTKNGEFWYFKPPE